MAINRQIPMFADFAPFVPTPLFPVEEDREQEDDDDYSQPSEQDKISALEEQEHFSENVDPTLSARLEARLEALRLEPKCWYDDLMDPVEAAFEMCSGVWRYLKAQQTAAQAIADTPRATRCTQAELTAITMAHNELTRALALAEEAYEDMADPTACARKRKGLK